MPEDILFDLKKFRKEILIGEDGKPLTQKILAEKLEVSQAQVSRWEKEPETMTLQDFIAICKLSGMAPSQILNEYQLIPRPEPLDFGNPYEQRDKQYELLDRWFSKRVLQNFKTKKSQIDDDLLSELETGYKNLEKDLRYKIVIGILGGYDVGKSRLANTIMGEEILPAEWTPTTSITTCIKHIDDMPKYIKDDFDAATVHLFQGTDELNKGWDFREFRNKDHYIEFELKHGDRDLLKKFGTHNGSGDQELKNDIGSALIFSDAPILKSCDLVDFPGYGEMEENVERIISDEKQAQRAKNVIDGLLFLSRANQFMNRDDILYLNDVIRELNTKSPEILSPFDRLLVVVTQAHIVESKELNKLESRLNDVYEQLPERIKSYKHANEDFAKTFATYTLENATLRKKFETKFNEIVIKNLIPYYQNRIEDRVEDYKTRSIKKINNEIHRLKSTLEHTAETQEILTKVESERPQLKKDRTQAKKKLHRKIKKIEKDNRESFKAWWDRSITEEQVTARIKKQYGKKNGKEKAKKYLANYYLGNAKDYIENLIEQSYKNRLEDDLSEYFEEYKKSAKKMTSSDKIDVEIPFDFEGALAGALASAGVIGGLGLWASSLGNLGWYILTAKGVSLLSSIGISISGGVAGAISALGYIGGPVTLAGGLAVLFGLGIRKIFGKSWEERVAKKLVQAFEKEEIYQKMDEQLAKFWSDTSTGLDEVTKKISKEMDKYVKNLRETLKKADDPENLKIQIKEYEKLLSMYENLIW